jgi:Fur family ferric uptake transcriptional regulator
MNARADRDAIFSLIKERGLKLTRTRRAVVEALLEERGHVTPEDLARRLAASSVPVHYTTVYRTLNALEAIGVLQHLHVGHGAGTYQLPAAPHHHLCCDRCGRVVELSAGEVPRGLSGLLAEKGFARDSEITITATCLACAKPRPR